VEVAPYVFVGGVDISHACLEALCELGLPPALAVGYDASRAQASGYRDLGDLAQRHGFRLVRTADVNDPALVDRIEALAPKLLYVLGWSQLVHPRLLGVAEHGAAGVHPTRLPEGRGRAPVPWTILKGLRETACTLFLLTEGVDDGPIVGQVPVAVAPREDARTLYAKHRAAHLALVREHTPALLAGTARTTAQDHAAATYWERRRPEDGRIDWTAPAEAVDRLVRAVTRPFPGAFSERDGRRAVIWRAEPAGDVGAAPGTVVERDGTPHVACGEGSLRVLEADGLEALRSAAA
jgi:methionyl-tRNA formyltransferase